MSAYQHYINDEHNTVGKLYCFSLQKPPKTLLLNKLDGTKVGRTVGCASYIPWSSVTLNISRYRWVCRLLERRLWRCVFKYVRIIQMFL